MHDAPVGHRRAVHLLRAKCLSVELDRFFRVADRKVRNQAVHALGNLLYVGHRVLLRWIKEQNYTPAKSRAGVIRGWPRSLSCRVSLHLFELFREFIYEDRLLAVRASRDHADLRSALALHEIQILLRLLGKLVEFGDALGG